MASGGLLHRFRILILAIIALGTTGRNGWCDEPLIPTKWAMDNEDYARQYNVPYSSVASQRRSQIFHEMLDARFQEENYGVYVGGGGALNTWSVGQLDTGVFKMPTAWSTVRLGGIGMVAGGKPMAGAELGFRLHTATRLAPYVGVNGVLELGGFARHISYNRYYYDTSGNRHNNPRWGYFPTGMAAIVPEAGLSYWLNSSTRLNVGAGYYITGGHQPDFLLVSASLDIALRRPSPQTYELPPVYNDVQGDPYFFPDRFNSDLPVPVNPPVQTLSDQEPVDLPRLLPPDAIGEDEPSDLPPLLPRDPILIEASPAKTLPERGTSIP